MEEDGYLNTKAKYMQVLEPKESGKTERNRGERERERQKEREGEREREIER